MQLQINRKNYILNLSTPSVYVDNESRGRSGHMSHAMTEFAKGCFIDFNSNCSPVRCNGHAAYGWIEYRISRDCGKSYSEPRTLPYSYDAFMDGIFTISIEKAVTASDGSIVAFCLRNTMLAAVCCEPWLTPTVIKSTDGGEIWNEPREVSQYKGRIYDALCIDGKIYFLQFKNDGSVRFTGTQPEHKYSIFCSEDNGESFYELSELPIPYEGRGYGSLLYDGELLHAYAYNEKSECEMDHAVSRDFGVTWEYEGVCKVAKGIRNPQTALIDGIYILHGRGEKEKGFVIYSSPDGYSWDEGEYLEREKRLCYYSNNILLNDEGRNFLLIQYSDVYKAACVNVMHMRLDIEKIQGETKGGKKAYV